VVNGANAGTPRPTARNDDFAPSFRANGPETRGIRGATWLRPRVSSPWLPMVVGVSTKPIKPGLADRFCLLAVSQLQTQMSRSGTLDTSALGVVSACAAIAAIVLGVRSANHLWIAALVLLVLALGLALRALRLPGAKQNGPSVLKMLDARASNDDEIIEDDLLKDLAKDVQSNERTIARKDRLLAWAVAMLVLAIVLELAGVQ